MGFPMFPIRSGLLVPTSCAPMTEAGAVTAADLLPGYTSPTATPEPGKAPGMQAKLISGTADGPRTYAVIFHDGDDIMSGLTEWVAKERIGAAQLSAIGAFGSAMFGWFDKDQRAYRNIPVDEQCECVGLLGDVGIAEGKPALHIHGAVGLPDGTLKGGHFLHAIASPTLEMFVSEMPVTLHKRQDPATTLELFDLDL